MKKVILVLITILLGTFSYAQDACYKIYMEGLQEYNKGHYIEAQRKFVIVAQTCGDYSDVWNKLKSCNKIIAEKQSQQINLITSLKSEKQEIEAAKKKAESAYTNDMLNAAKQIKNAETLIRLKSDTIQMQRKWNMEWRDSVMRVNHRLDSIKLELDSVNHQLAVAIENANKDKKKNDKKASKPQEQIVPLVQDTLTNDTINISK